MNYYLDVLEKSGNSLMIYKDGVLMFESDLGGIRPHLKAINEHGGGLEGTHMVDKILGRAAAFLVVYSKAAEAITNIVSTSGKQVLEDNHLKFSYREEIAHIKMKDGVGLLEQSVTLERVDGADELDRRIVDVRLEKIVEVILVLDYAGYDQIHAGIFRDLDG